MSDPLEKDQIEDVLSSIRRLVSEDVRSFAEPEAVGAPKPVAQEPAEKLVLSPSLRVEKTAAPAVNLRGAQEGVAGNENAKAPDTGPRVLTLSKTSADVMPEPEDKAAVQPVGEVVEAEVEVSEGTEPEVALAAPESELKDDDMPAVEWHSVRSYGEVEFEPAAAGDGDYAGTEVDALDWSQSSDTADGATDPTPAEDIIDVQAIASEAIEEEVAEAVLDEDMLRDLVGEIVRQELQGPLGERITRNVRKLVRREINRALSSRQAD